MTPDLDAVRDLVRDVAIAVINPRFRALADNEVSEKSAGEVVTIVDREAEAALGLGLRALAPEVPIIGEEAASGDPDLLRLLDSGGPVLLVDPLDGTPGFVAGSPDHAVMVVLVVGGETAASVIYQPQHDRMFVTERGSGAFLNGRRLPPPMQRPAELSALRGAVLRRFLDQPARNAIERNAHRFGDLTPGSRCAGIEYPLIAQGQRDFLLFWRTLPWDHAAGALLVTETAGAARHLDGTDYTPCRPKEGLLVTGTQAQQRQVGEGLGLRS